MAFAKFTGFLKEAYCSTARNENLLRQLRLLDVCLSPPCLARGTAHDHGLHTRCTPCRLSLRHCGRTEPAWFLRGCFRGYSECACAPRCRVVITVTTVTTVVTPVAWRGVTRGQRGRTMHTAGKHPCGNARGREAWRNSACEALASSCRSAARQASPAPPQKHAGPSAASLMTKPLAHSVSDSLGSVWCAVAASSPDDSAQKVSFAYVVDNDTQRVHHTAVERRVPP